MNIRQSSVLLSRLALFLIYFWFGILKIIKLSPASAIVTELFNKTIAHIPFLSGISSGTFLIIFGIFEVAVGILFLLPGKERLAIVAFFAHIITTTLPLLFLKTSVWTHIMVPTLEGQYIIKNVALLACVVTVWSAIPKRPVETVPYSESSI